MSIADLNRLENTTKPWDQLPNWSEAIPEVYRCDVCLIPEKDGSFSAIVLNLPGTGSCGATREEALQNVREAVLGVVESYAAHGEEIPWRDSLGIEVPKGADRKWILVNA
jgi:predicted RNase H-like HicB family nuclease